METANLDGSITVYKIKDPSFDLCKGCNKVRFFSIASFSVFTVTFMFFCIASSY